MGPKLRRACGAGLTLWLAAAWAGAVTGRAEVSAPQGSPYRVILERNVFGLKDPPVPPVVVNTPTTPPPVKSVVQLTGISISPAGKYALLVLPVGPGRTNQMSLRLSTRPDDEQEGIKVVEINERERMVKIRNAGVEETLDFKNNAPAFTMPAAAPGGPKISVPGRPGVGVPTPVPGRPGAIPLPAGRVGAASLNAPASPGVSRVARSSVGGAQPGFTSEAGGSAVGLRTVPARQIRTAPEAPNLGGDSLEQHISLQLQEEAARSQGIPFPPTPPLPR